MAWNEATVTNKGLELLGASLSGGSFVITEAVGGETCSAAVSLMGLTRVTDPCHSLKIAKVSRSDGMLTVNVRVQNVGIEKGFVLKQIGLFARHDSVDGHGDSTLFAVIQDCNGEKIPSQTENPEFLLEFDFVIPVSNTENICAVISPGIFATLEELGYACDSFNGEIAGIDGKCDVLEKGFNELYKGLSEHEGDAIRHITEDERISWNNKAAGNHTHPAATVSAAGLMSAADKKKLNGVAASANNYTLPLATASVLGGVKVGYAANGKNYPVQLSDEQMFVNVPWTDNNTTYSNMTAATASTSGKAGLVPAPAAGKQTCFLRGDGTWAVPTNTTYSPATQSAAGLMSANDKKKLDGVADSSNNYMHPTTAGNKHIPAGGSANQILAYSADGTAKWSNTCNAAAMDVVLGSKTTPTAVMVAYKPNRTKAIVMGWVKSPTEGYPAYASYLFTGLSNDMIATSNNTAFSSNNGFSVNVTTTGEISIAGFVGGYAVIWFN